MKFSYTYTPLTLIQWLGYQNSKFKFSFMQEFVEPRTFKSEPATFRLERAR